MAIPAAADGATKALSVKTLGAGTIGNVLEWYDFGLYGYLAPTIGQQFFPSTSPVASLIGAYAGFAIGFAMRPIGGFVLGNIGDRLGRRPVLIASVVMMGVATSAIGLLPTYAKLGIWAPILLLLVRLFQGFSVGGEFTGSVSFLIETAPRKRRGLAGSFANIGSTVGVLVAAGVAAVTVMFAKSHPAETWIWRIPFVGGGLLAILAYWMRTRLTDSGFDPQEDGHQHDEELPLKQALIDAPRGMALAVLFTWGYGVADYLTLVFLPTFASNFGAIDHGAALTVNTLSQIVALAVIPISGWLTDRMIRRRKMLILAFGMILASAVGLFSLSRGPGIISFVIAQIAFAAMLGMIMGAAPAMLGEMFRSRYRLSVTFSLFFHPV